MATKFFACRNSSIVRCGILRKQKSKACVSTHSVGVVLIKHAGEEIMAKKIGIPARQPTRKPGVGRYNRIIAAAEFLILEAGSLVTITLDAVAKQAAVPRASLYYFFASIETLLDALYQRGVQKIVAELPQPPKAADWRKVMVLYIDSVRDFYLKNRVEMLLEVPDHPTGPTIYLMSFLAT